MSDKSLVLKWKDVSQSFGAVQALNNFSAEVRSGSVTALLGPNGAGKSTLIDITMGLNKPSTGSATVFGMKPEQAIANGLVGCIFQNTYLPGGLTCRKLLQTLNSAISHTIRAEDLLETVQLQRFADRKIGKLSGGERQRLRLALALLNNPPLLIMDEPTAGLDINARSAFWQLMQKLAEQGRTILFATHYLAEAQSYADRVLVIEHGNLVLDGTVAQMRSKAEAHLSFTLAPELQPELLTQIKERVGDRQITVHTEGQMVNIKGSGLDPLLRQIAAFNGTANYQLIPASLEEAFTEITKGA